MGIWSEVRKARWKEVKRKKEKKVKIDNWSNIEKHDQIFIEFYLQM